MCKKLLQEPFALQKVAQKQLTNSKQPNSIISILQISSGFGGVWTIDSVPLVLFIYFLSNFCN